MADLNQRFQNAVAYIKNSDSKTVKLSNQDKLTFYALFK
jgi:hypothetical protein